jgi:uncharacterized protein YjbI with pentapeptide repeats
MGTRVDGRRGALVAAVWAVWLSLALEWLFVATMPSFMDALGLGERLRIPLVAPLLVVPPVLVLTGILGWVVPAAVLASAAVLLVDNFTQTLFGFGIASTAGGWQAAYGVLWLALLVGIYRALRRTARGIGEQRFRTLARATAALVLVAAAGAAWRWARTAPDPDRDRGAVASRRPNILILSTDGVDAGRMSAYGYRRDTTPFIRTLVPRALLGENTLPNGTITVASLVSMLTGKLPIRTRVYATKDVLLGADAYQTLPAILRRTGYATVAHVPGVVDPFSQNLRDAFDLVNARTARGAVVLPAIPDTLALALAPEVYFLQHTSDRLTARLGHLTGVRPITSPLKEVTSPQEVSDTRRVRALLDFVARSPRPVFAFVHLMGTHGPFAPRHRRFSRDPKDPKGASDDAIIDYDRHVARVVRGLARRGKLDDTVLVIMSDHGSVRRAARIPLAIVFPGGEHRGRISENVQLLDLAPTLLDHLGLPIPAWMEGQSLLAHPPDRWRPIFTVDVFRGAPGGERMSMLAVTVCDRMSELDFFRDKVTTRTIEGHTAGCNGEGVPGVDEARRLIDERLRANGLEPEAVVANVRELEMVGANMVGAHLAGARLAGRFLNAANLTRATLAGADLVGTTLGGANLTDADLTGADIRKGRLHQANLTRAKLSRVNLTEARLPSVRAPGADFSDATLRSAWLVGADLSGANLSGADLTGAVLSNTTLVGARLEGATLRNANLANGNLSRANLRGADLTGANIKGVILEGADLTGATMPAVR